jgi:hypothetical protein
LAREKHPQGYDYNDEWNLLNEDKMDYKTPWYQQANDEYKYVSSRREKLLPYKQYLENMKIRFKKNQKIHKEEAKKYLMQYSSQNFIKQTRKYYVIDEFLNLPIGKYLISSLEKEGFNLVFNARKVEDNNAILYNKKLEKEIEISITHGISWCISYSAFVEYGVYENRRINCKDDKYKFDGCLIDDEIDYKIRVDKVIEKLLASSLLS